MIRCRTATGYGVLSWYLEAAKANTCVCVSVCYVHMVHGVVPAGWAVRTLWVTRVTSRLWCSSSYTRPSGDLQTISTPLWTSPW